MINLQFKTLDGDFTIHRYNKSSTLPENVFKSEFYWIGRTDDELSIVCDSKCKLNSDKYESGWKALKLIGPFKFSEVGIVSGITKLLAEKGICVFVLSTFDTDYILVKKENLTLAVTALVASDYSIIQ